MKGRKILTILKASRIYRTIPTLLLILFCVAYTNTMNTNIILLAIIFLMIYSYAGLQNAIVDKDYDNLEKNKQNKNYLPSNFNNNLTE